MAPKVKNVAESKRSRKGEASGSSSSRESVQKFGKKAVERYGLDWFACQQKAKYMGNEFVNELTETKYKTVSVRGKDVRFSARILNELLGTPNCDPDEFNGLKDKPPYRDIRHTLCGVESTARCGGIEEEAVDISVVYHPDLTGKLVDVTPTKALDPSHGPVLSAQERQARDDNVMARMFGMADLQLRIRGRPVIDAEMETMAERYPLSESATFLCKTGPAFLEPLDDDEPTADGAMDDDKEATDAADEANAFMVFDGGDDAP
ncbi:hypothetical protein KY284_033464 [Solanum tuberosum]|nr:hypothetical protein KY284_033464 [Solanum tuberosum]